MEFDELKRTWKEQKSNTDMDYSKSEILMLINNKMLSFEKDIKSRDRLEIIACILVMILFGFTLFTTESIWKQAGSVVIILSAAYIWYKLKRTQKETFEDEYSPDRPMIKYLNLELQSIRKHKKMLKNVAWWYLLPMLVGVLLFTIGFSTSLLAKVIYMAVVLLFGGFVWKLNQNAVQKKFDPMIAEITEAIEVLKSDKE